MTFQILLNHLFMKTSFFINRRNFSTWSISFFVDYKLKIRKLYYSIGTKSGLNMALRMLVLFIIFSLFIPGIIYGQASEADRGLGSVASWTPGPGDQLRIAAGETDITPGWPYPYNRAGVDDPPETKEELEAIRTYAPWRMKVLVIDDGNNSVVFLSADILNWRKSNGTVDEFRIRLHDQYGFEPDQIILNATHTHTGPDLGVDEYREYFIKSGVDLVGKVLKKLEPARLYFTRGRSELSINRRGLTREGFFIRRFNPYGSVDHELILLKAVNTDGNPIAFVTNYACHPTIISWRGLQIGGDYPNMAMHILEEQMDGDGIALFLQGTAGDAKVPNRRPGYPHRQAYLGGVPRVMMFSNIFAGDIIRTIEENDWERIEGKITTKLDLVNLPLMAGTIDPDGEGYEPFTGPERRMVRMAKMMLEAMDEEGNYYETRECEVYVAEIGPDFVFVGLNGEQNIPIGLRIKGQLLGRPVMVCGYTGPSIGYFPGYSQIPEAGYEAQTPYSPEAEDFLIKKVMEMISQGREDNN